jgi:hypothetical protein
MKLINTSLDDYVITELKGIPAYSVLTHCIHNAITQ